MKMLDKERVKMREKIGRQMEDEIDKSQRGEDKKGGILKNGKVYK